MKDNEKGTSQSSAALEESASKSDDFELDDYLSVDVLKELVERTNSRVHRLLDTSSYLQNDCRLHELPRFEEGDFTVGKLLGTGGFSVVHEIDSFAAGCVLPEKDKKYVIKTLNPALIDQPKTLVAGGRDMATEALFLSSLKHENIIALRGWPVSGVEGFLKTGRCDGFFLIFEKLDETLVERIASWRSDSLSVSEHDGSAASVKLLDQQLQAAIDISKAVEYLHKNRFAYRDLKPANIGFDSKGVLKLFDFGLAIELPHGAGIDSDKTFSLFGNMGTSRYMAIEVIRGEPYNLKVDVYSFSILLWEILALKKPFEKCTGEEVRDLVSNKGDRPIIPDSWSPILRSLLERGWSESMSERPTITEVKDMLQKAQRKTKVGRVGIWNYLLRRKTKSAANQGRNEERQRDLDKSLPLHLG